jgi:hypothetical protein
LSAGRRENGIEPAFGKGEKFNIFIMNPAKNNQKFFKSILMKNNKKMPKCTGGRGAGRPIG